MSSNSISNRLQQALRSDQAPIRRDAVATLIHLELSTQDEAQRKTLLEDLARYDPDDQVRLAAGTALGWDARLLNAIATAFHSSNTPSRLDAIVSLRFFLTQGTDVEASLAQEWLLRLSLHDDDKQVRQAADLALPSSERPRISKYATQDRRSDRLEKEIAERPGRGRLSRRALLGLIGLFMLSCLGGMGVRVAQGPVVRLMPPNTCTYIASMGVAGGAAMFQGGYGTNPTQRTLIRVDQSSTTGVDRPGEVKWLSLASDEIHVVETRREPIEPYYFIYTWEISRFADWNEQLLTEGWYPSWSPDMSQIAFFRVQSMNRYGLYVMNEDGSDIRKILDVGDVSSAASWSPDGTQLVISASEINGDVNNLYVVDVENGDTHLLLANEVNAFHPAWSPDGQTIAFASTEIYTINIDGSGEQNVTNGGFFQINGLGWSGDGLRLVLLGTDASGQGVFVVNPDGTGLHKIYSTCP